jgi:hypothetical protein
MGLCPETPISQLPLHPLPSQVRDMWYDWFCKDTSLENKGRRLLTKLRTITPSPRFDADKTYAFFKNNCPCQGKLYDDFRICEIGSGDVIYCVVPAEGYDRTYGQAVVWGKAPDTGEFEELVRGNWRDVKAFFRASDDEVLSIVEGTRGLNLILQAERDNAEFDRETRSKKWQAEWDARNADYEYRSQLSHLLGVEI